MKCISLGAKNYGLPAVTSLLVLLSAAGGVNVRAEDQGVSPLGSPENPNCRAVYAVGEVRKVVKCPAGTSFDFCFTRNLVDRGDLITGQLEYFSDPSKGAVHPHDPDTALTFAPMNIVTKQGTLQTHESGVYNPKTKEFSGVAKVVGGTGQFAGYSGKIMSLGYATGKALFTGTLCRE